MRLLPIVLLLLPWPVLAGPPRVVADIAPVHALVASVMQGIATPVLLTAPGASPHDHALRPSQARALARADVVVWIGPALTPWLDRAVANLGSGARLVGLLDAPGTVRLNDPGHGDGHDHGPDVDPHAWLDPANARTWLAAIAEALAETDPANADAYRLNARRAAAALDATEREVRRLLDPVRSGRIVLYHDGFRYFQAAFAIRPLAVIAGGDAARPGAARLSQVRALLAGGGGGCVFLEPQIPARAAEAVVAGTGARIAVLDPLGAMLEPGPGLYSAVLLGLARAMHDCLAQ